MKNRIRTASAHTPGPWYVYEDARPIVMATKSDNKYDISELCCDDLTTGEIAANARLIAAAPDLLEQAKALITNWENGNLSPYIQSLQEAVNKAERL